MRLPPRRTVMNLGSRILGRIIGIQHTGEHRSPRAPTVVYASATVPVPVCLRWTSRTRSSPPTAPSPTLPCASARTKWALAWPAYARFHDGQTVRDSLNLMAYENLCVPNGARGPARAWTTNPEFDGDLLGDDVGGELRAPRVRSGRVRSSPPGPRRDRPHLLRRRVGRPLPVRHLAQSHDGALRRRRADSASSRTCRGRPYGAIHAIATEGGDLLRQRGSFRPRSRCPMTQRRRTDSSDTSADSRGTGPRSSSDRSGNDPAERAESRDAE